MVRSSELEPPNQQATRRLIELTRGLSVCSAPVSWCPHIGRTANRKHRDGGLRSNFPHRGGQHMIGTLILPQRSDLLAGIRRHPIAEEPDMISLQHAQPELP